MGLAFVGPGKMGVNMVDAGPIKGYVVDSGEGRWTVRAGLDEDLPMLVSALSLMAGFQSRDPKSFAGNCLAALPNEFARHDGVHE